MPTHGAEVVNRYNKLKGERYNFDERWERMAPYLAPSRIGITTKLSQGEKQSRGVYDSTTIAAAEQMAHFIAGHIINPAQKWFTWEPYNPVVARLDSAREWCEEAVNRALRRLANSKFYAEGPETLIDWGGFGTGFLLGEEAPQPVNETVRGFRGFYFCAEKTGRFVISEGSGGLVDTAFREYEMSRRALLEQWPDGKFPEAIRNGKEPDKTFKILHAIIPRPKAERSAGALGMPWASAWIELDSKHVFYESGYRLFPAAVPRYQRTPGEVYGRGRGDIVFPDTWTLNSAKRMGLQDWALKIQPPILHRSDAVTGTLRLVPAGSMPVNTHGSALRDAIMPWETGSKPEVSQLKEDELRRSIREIFYVDIIRQLLETHKSEMTRFEFARKLELLFNLIGPVYGRMEYEFLEAILNIIFDTMYVAGEFPPPPPEMLDAGGALRTVFQNPIAKAQKAGDADALAMAVNDLAPLGQLVPEVWDGYDPDKVRDGINRTRGVPAEWLRNDEEIAAIRAARHEQNVKDNQMAEAQAATESMRNAAPLIAALQKGAK